MINHFSIAVHILYLLHMSDCSEVYSKDYLCYSSHFWVLVKELNV